MHSLARSSPVFVVAYHLGMRTGELLALKRSWLDLEEGLIYVNGLVTKNRSPKTAPIYGDMRPWLEMLLRRGQIESPKCIWLFSRNEKPVKDFKADWEQACETAGVPALLFHDLRRTAVRNMIRAGVPEKSRYRFQVTRPQACFGATTSPTLAISKMRENERSAIWKGRK